MALGKARTAISRLVRARAGKKQAVRACWYSIVKAKTTGSYVVRINGVIGVDKDEDGNVVGVSAMAFMKQLRSIRDLKKLRVDIFSEGGNVFDGMHIYAGLRSLSQSGVQVTTRIGALAASIASVIAMAGDVVEIHESSSFMIHDPWMPTKGNADELRKSANMLEKLRASMMTAYTRKNPSVSLADLEAMLKAETWFTGAEAVEAGFADVLLSESLDTEALARADMIVNAMATKSKAKDKTKSKPSAQDELIAKIVAALAETDDEEDPNAEVDEDEDPNAETDDEEDPMAAALGAIAETLQEILDIVKGEADEPVEDDEEDPNAEVDEDEDPNAETDDEKPNARTRRGARAAAGKSVDTSSKTYAALKKIAKANGQLGDFVTYVAAGASLKQLQKLVIDAADPTASIKTGSGARKSTKPVAIDADAYYAGMNGKKKEA